MKADEVLATTARAWAAPMDAGEYGAFLNELLEAERAGAKLISAYMDELPERSPRWEALQAVQRDEARNCSVLIHLLLEAEAVPGPGVGSFYARGLAIRGWRERIDFLNRGQAWVAKRLAAALPRVPQAARKALDEMHRSHVRNIASCEAQA